MSEPSLADDCDPSIVTGPKLSLVEMASWLATRDGGEIVEAEDGACRMSRNDMPVGSCL